MPICQCHWVEDNTFIPQHDVVSGKSLECCHIRRQMDVFATQDGVIQYDGSAIDLFRLNNRYAARSVRMDEESYRLYVGGINEFGYFVPSSSESLKYVCLSDSVGNDRYIGNIWGIYPSKNEVYAQGDMNIIVYDQDKNQHYRIDCSFKLDCSNMIDDVLWLGSGDGLKF